MSEWISVKDGLPEADRSVLFYIELPWISGKKGFCVISDGSDGIVYRYNFVTHWMPLPKPPEKKPTHKVDSTPSTLGSMKRKYEMYPFLKLLICQLFHSGQKQYTTTGIYGPDGMVDRYSYEIRCKKCLCSCVIFEENTFLPGRQK